IALLINFWGVLGNGFASEILDEKSYVTDSHRGFIGNYTFTERLIHNPDKVREFLNQYAFSPVVNKQFVEKSSSDMPAFEIIEIGMGEKRVVQNKDLILYTKGIADCIGIAVWEPEEKIAALYHASKMELRDNELMFKEHFIDVIKKDILDLSKVEVNIISFYWSQDALTVVKLFQKNGFKITGLSIPDAAKENTEFEDNTYINKNTVPSNYLAFKERVPRAAMSLNTRNGQVGYKLY
ncbi:MAG: hypothetical protein IBJ00_04690, partial [Alphaproteobacteria bacterium]|nr:hypothetical protein [Alphaproteobacteria bacterium]